MRVKAPWVGGGRNVGQRRGRFYRLTEHGVAVLAAQGTTKDESTVALKSHSGTFREADDE